MKELRFAGVVFLCAAASAWGCGGSGILPATGAGGARGDTSDGGVAPEMDAAAVTIDPGSGGAAATGSGGTTGSIAGTGGVSGGLGGATGPTDGLGGSTGPTDGLGGDTGAGGASGPSGAGGASGPSGAGGADVPTGAGGASGPSGAGGADVPTGVGGADVPTGTGGAGPVTGTGGAAGSAVAAAPPCSDLFAPTLQELGIDISAADWAAIQAEFLSAGMLRDDVFVDYQPLYYPVTFHVGAEAVPAYVRLKGDSSWREAVTFDGAAGKMQLVIAFDRINSSATFHGVSKFALDMPRSDLTFLHDRFGNAFMRSLGIASLCATSARLSVNGSYYGLFTLEERMGHRLIKQYFPAIPDNDLFKGGWVPETNENTFDWMKLNSFWAASTPADVAALVDLPQSFLTWAAEALLNDGDGYWGGDHNFFIYDQGPRGYVFLPNDMDSILDFISDFHGDPVWWWSSRPGVQFIGQQYRIVMGDAGMRAQYAQALRTQLSQFDVVTLQSWIDSWSAQIRDSVATDPHRPAMTTMAVFDASIAVARAGIQTRADYVRAWLDCQQSGVGADQDGDGFVWCHDCRDDQPAIHPGAAEICGNLSDDNCDGVYDEGCPALPPPPPPPPPPPAP